MDEKKRKGTGPLTRQREQEIFEVAKQVLVERGYEGFTMDEVAVRARCSKPTLYRRWSDKSRLIIDLVASTPEPKTAADTGSLRGDLRDLLGQVVGSATSERGRLVLGIGLAMQNDPELAAAWRQYGLIGGRAALATIVDRAVERGEIATRPNLKLLFSLLPGTFVWRAYIEGERKTLKRFADDLLDTVLMPYFLNAGSPSAGPPDAAYPSKPQSKPRRPQRQVRRIGGATACSADK